MTPFEMRKKRSITATTPAPKMIQSQVINFLKPCDMTMTVSISSIRPWGRIGPFYFIGSHMQILFSVPNLPLFANSVSHLLLRTGGDAFEHNSKRSNSPLLMLPPTHLFGGETTIVHVLSYLQTQVSMDGESICIPIFQQKEAVRDIKRLCETIAPYEGGIFAPLKLPDKSGSNRRPFRVLYTRSAQ